MGLDRLRNIVMTKNKETEHKHSHIKLTLNDKQRQ